MRHSCAQLFAGGIAAQFGGLRRDFDVVSHLVAPEKSLRPGTPFFKIGKGGQLRHPRRPSADPSLPRG